MAASFHTCIIMGELQSTYKEFQTLYNSNMPAWLLYVNMHTIVWNIFHT